MTLVPPSSRLTATDPLQTYMGLQSWNFTPHGIAGASSPVSQTLYALAVPTTAGVSYTGVRLNVGTAGSGTAPANFFVGLATTAAFGAKGTMLAQSADLAASSSLTVAGQNPFPFTAPAAETVTGMRIVLVVINGAFGTTNVTLSRGAAGNTFNPNNGHDFVVVATAGAAVTALPANGQQLAANYAASSSPLDFWAGLY